MATTIPDFLEIEWKGQLYRLSDVRLDHDNRTFVDWTTWCPDCQQQFQFTTGRTFRAARRRCDDCKTPRHPVGDMHINPRFAPQLNASPTE